MTPGAAVLLATSSSVRCCGTLRRLSTIGRCKQSLQLTGASFPLRRGDVWSVNNLQTLKLASVVASAMATMDKRNFLPGKEVALYSHSLPAIEAWLQDLGFMQSEANRAVWIIERPDWHAQLSLDYTELYIRYLHTGPGNLDRDVERKFNYALSREDVENAVLGGP